MRRRSMRGQVKRGARLGQQSAAPPPRLSVELDWVDALDLGPGRVVLDGVTFELPGATIDGDGLVYAALDRASGTAELACARLGEVWAEDDWQGREPVFIGSVRDGAWLPHPLVAVKGETAPTEERADAPAKVRYVGTKPIHEEETAK